MPQKRRPAIVSPPANILKIELEAREWDVHEFALLSELPLDIVEGLLSTEQQVNSEIAKKLSKLFGTSEGVWLNLERNYREWLATVPQPPVSTRQETLSETPLTSKRENLKAKRVVSPTSETVNT